MKPKTHMLIASVATLVGIVVGAGFLGIPKAMTLSGYLPGVLLMIIVSLVAFIMCLFAIELALNTKKVHQMPGMITKYLGKKIGIISSIIFALISFGAMSAYLTGSSDILSVYTGIDQVYCMIIYFFLVFFFVWKGLKLIEKAETYLGIAMLIFLIILAIIMRPDFDVNNLTSLQTSDLLVPLGVIIFSFGGYNVMMQVEEITNGNKELMIKTSIIGTIIPFIFFFTFATLMLGVFGNNIGNIATESLAGIIGAIGNSLAFFAMTSSYIISGLLWKDMLIDDYGISKKSSVLIAMFSPFIFTLLVSPNFIDILAYTGAVLAGIFSIIVCITIITHRKKIRKSYYKTPGGIITPIIIAVFFAIGIGILFV